jgi:cbb3-type cytochrome oxidase subunit 3
LEEGRDVLDAFFLVVAVIFFVGCLAYIVGCEQL